MNREITLMDFFRFILSKLKLVLIFGCIAAIIAAGLVVFTADERYNYSGSFIVDPFGNVDENFNSNNIYNELTISRTLIPSFVELMQKKDFAEIIAKSVNEKLDTELEYNDIIDMIRYTTNEDTLIIDFRCTSIDKDVSFTVAKTISEKAPGYVEQKLNRINLNAVDTINKDVYGTSKTDFKVAGIVAFIVAAVLTVLISLVIELLDNRIKTPEDITEHFEYPILGSIPDFYKHTKKEGYYGKQKTKQQVNAQTK